jgi:phenylpropionate dioxygenase-like ring-hydroxylating dioxygenase large terminal subunit
MATVSPTYAELGIDPVAVEDALDANLTFPAAWYSDRRIYEFELEHVFTRCWQVAAPLHMLEKPGDHIVTNVAHIPIVVTRDLEGELHGFVNVCRHRAYPVATKDGNRRTLQCKYHAWTYELDGRLRSAPGCGFEQQFDKADFSLVPVAVDTWDAFVWVNPDPDAPPLREAHPDFEPLAAERGLTFEGYRYYGRFHYEIPANWKVWVENATECYHCPTIHPKSFSDAFDVSRQEYEYVNTGRILGQFTRYNPKAHVFRPDRFWSEKGFRFIYLYPTTFFAVDDLVAFPGMIFPTGPETCAFTADMYVHPDCTEAEMEEWVEMYNRTLTEDAEAVRVQQPGLRSKMVPHGRLMPSRESAISSFHRMVWSSFREALEDA